MNVRALTGVGVAAVFALTACGSSSPSTLTKEQWVSQANAICKDLNDRSDAAAPKSQADYGKAIAAFATIANEDVPKLAALKPPTEIQADVAAMNAAYAKALTVVKDAAAAATGGDLQTAISKLGDLDETTKTGNDIAARLGATECNK